MKQQAMHKLKINIGLYFCVNIVFCWHRIFSIGFFHRTYSIINNNFHSIFIVTLTLHAGRHIVKFKEPLKVSSTIYSFYSKY